MHPILFTIAGFPIYSYGVALALAFLVGTVLAARDAKKVGLNPDRIVDMAIIIVISSIVGARVAYVLSEPGTVQGIKAVLDIRSGGLSFQGGLLGGVLAGVAYCKLAKVNPWRVAEVVPGPMALGYAIARLGGCFLNGCCYGLPTKSGLGMVFPVIDSLERHPTQIYASLGGLAIFAIITMVKRRSRMFIGFPMFLFTALYAAERFIVEMFRDRPLAVAQLSLAQLFCIGGFLFAVISIAILSKTRGAGDRGALANNAEETGG